MTAILVGYICSTCNTKSRNDNINLDLITTYVIRMWVKKGKGRERERRGEGGEREREREREMERLLPATRRSTTRKGIRD